MSIFEYDEEKVIAMIRQEEYQDGVQQGLEEGLQQGLAQGIEEGIRALILDNLEEAVSAERILMKLQKRFGLSEEQAGEYLDRYKSE